MGTSTMEGTELIMRVISEVGPRSILDVGCGAGRYGFLCREILDRRTWIERLSTGSGPSELRLDAIEIFPGNITRLHRLIYDEIIIDDVRAVLDSLDNYDLILMGDLIEHFTKADGRSLLKSLYGKCNKLLILKTPASRYVQGPAYGNEAERHLSFWNTKEFQCFPRSVVQVVGQEMGRPMYVVALCRDEHVFEIAGPVLVPGSRERFKAVLSDLLGARRVNSVLRALRWKGAY